MKIYIEFNFKGEKVASLRNLPYGVGTHYKYQGNAGEVIRTLSNAYVAGLGEKEKLTLHHVWNTARIAAEKASSEIRTDDICFKNVREISENMPFTFEQIAHAVVLGATTGLYQFNKYKTNNASDETVPLVSVLDFHTQKEANIIADAYKHTRDMIEMSPNDLYPESFCSYTFKMLSETTPPLYCLADGYAHDFHRPLVEKYYTKKINESRLRMYVFEDEQYIEKTFPSLWAVGKGAERKPRMLVVEYKHPDARNTQPDAWVGKGICMDTGGDDSKPADAKKLMRMDMSGAANIMGALQAVARRNIKTWIVALCPLAINKPGLASYTQEEIVGTYKNGPNNLIRNTDAEGRVVLSDALRLAALEWNPRRIIELSTLTGAAIVTVGDWGRTLAMSNNQELEKEFLRAAEHTGQRVSFLPLDEEAFDNVQDKESGADYVNVGNCGRWGGSLTAGAFLFSQNKKEAPTLPMIHWDIAPSLEKPQFRGQEVRTLVRLAEMSVKESTVDDALITVEK